MRLADSLRYVTKIAFPDIQCDWRRINGEGAEAVFAALEEWNEVDNYVHVNFKKGVESLAVAIVTGQFAVETEVVAMQLLVALCNRNVGYCRDRQYRKGSKNEIILKLYQSSDAFAYAVNGSATLAPELSAALLVSAFLDLDEKSFESVCDNCIRGPYQKEPIPDPLRELISDMFKYNHDFEGMVTEENIDQLWRMGTHLDKTVPELRFLDDTKDGSILVECKRGMDAIREARPLLDSIAQGVIWIGMDAVPDSLELQFRYPNGKNGEVLRYIFEEYGSAEKQTSSLWLGTIAKKNLALLENFSTVVNYITFDPRFFELFDKHHLPTMVHNGLANQSTHYFRSLMYQETKAVLGDHKLAQKQRREQLYAEVVLTEKASPKWKSEFLLFSLVHDSYGDAIYQYRTQWLGAQSLDVFIPSLNIGIEYQGKQHYEAIEYFGGKRSFEANKARDARKRRICAENGVELIEWPYTEAITSTNLERHLCEVGIDA